MTESSEPLLQREEGDVFVDITPEVDELIAASAPPPSALRITIVGTPGEGQTLDYRLNVEPDLTPAEIAVVLRAFANQFDSTLSYEGRMGDVHREDQDINAWVELIPDWQSDEHEVWVQVHSADDDQQHPELDEIAGRRVRVKIELL